jgi:hypothetical protein
MNPRMSAAQRDALYDQILERLSGIGDVWIAVSSEDFEAAGRLGREYSDDLRLVLDDLGWGEGPEGAVELETPPDVLRRVFSRLRDTATDLRAGTEQERAELRELDERHQLVLEACCQVLDDLDATQSSD